MGFLDLSKHARKEKWNTFLFYITRKRNVFHKGNTLLKVDKKKYIKITIIMKYSKIEITSLHATVLSRSNLPFLLKSWQQLVYLIYLFVQAPRQYWAHNCRLSGASQLVTSALLPSTHLSLLVALHFLLSLLLIFHYLIGQLLIFCYQRSYNFLFFLCYLITCLSFLP